MKRVVALSVIGGCAAAGFLLTRPAGEVAPPVTSSAPPFQTDSARPNVGFLETRDHRIELKTGGRYTIRTKDGKVVAKDMTLSELRAAKPNLHRILERAMASGRNNDAGGPSPANEGFGAGTILRRHNDAGSD